MALTLKVLTDEDEARLAMTGMEQFHGAKEKLDELFLQWLAMPDTGDLFAGLLDDVRRGVAMELPQASLTAALLRTASSSSMTGPSSGSPRRPRHSPPPRSPSRSPVPGSSPGANVGTGTGMPAISVPTLQQPQFGFEGGDRSPPAEKSPVSPSPASPTDRSASTPAASPSTPPKPPVETAALVSPPPPGTRGSTPGPSTPIAGAAGSASAEDVPVFYTAGAGGRGRGRPLERERLEDKLNLIVEVCKAALGGRPANLVNPPVPAPGDVEVCGCKLASEDLDMALRVDHFPAVAKTLCGFPSFFAAPLFRRIKQLYNLGPAPAAEPTNSKVEDSEENTDEDRGEVPLRVFLQFWRDEMEPFDHVDRFFRLTKQVTAPHIVKADLLPLMEELLAFHPGLAFLETTPEFQEKYARTVIARMFFRLDPTNRGCITARALRRSNLIAAFQHVDMEEDINLVNEYFSYEHFYVLYCKFWELDLDHDFLLSRDDLDGLGNHSLTKAILDRMFTQAGRKFECKEPGKMGYEDFVCFLMCEEDKTNEVSIRFWFKLIDLDGDGVIRPYEMRHFYAEQMERMESMNCEVVPFEDVLCQMSDLLQPDVEGEFRLKDFLNPTRVRLTGVFFSILSNLNKFTAFEQRDPFVVKQQQEPGYTAWDRYAQIEYARLAMEDDTHDDSMSQQGDAHGWDDEEDDDLNMRMQAGTSNESPF